MKQAIEVKALEITASTEGELVAQKIFKSLFDHREDITPRGELQDWEVFNVRQSEQTTTWRQDYAKKLGELRLGVEKDFAPVTESNIENVQAVLTAGYQELLKTMLNEAIRFLGKPPCPYAWIGAGSFSRGEVLPYSDAEYLWLFEDETLSTRWYFWALDKLIVAQLHCVNEPGGLHPDQYPEVSDAEGTDEPLPSSMQTIQYAFKVNCRTPEGVYTQIISGLQGRLIAGDPLLWDKQMKALRRNDLSGIFYKLLLVSVNEYKKTWKDERGESDRHDVKKGYGFFLTYLAVMLKFYHGVKGDSAQAIWTALIDHKKIEEKLGHALARASREIQALRYRTQFFYADGRQDFQSKKTPQKESGKSKEREKIYRLTGKEEKTLTEIQAQMQRVYTHLSAAKQLSQLGSPPKGNLSLTLPDHDTTVTVINVLPDYQSLLPAWMIPCIDQGVLQRLLWNLLEQPEKLHQASHWGCFEFALVRGAKGNIQNSVGLTPMRLVLRWSETHSALAEKVWRGLLKSEGDLTEKAAHHGGSLLSQAMAEQKHSSFALLCHLGAGRDDDAEKLLTYIRQQRGSKTTSAEQKKSLVACLPQLMQQNPLLAWHLALEAVCQETLSSASKIRVEGVQTPKGHLHPALAKTLFTEKEKVQAVNTYGRRKVAKCKLNPLIQVYAKFYPELPGIEEAVKRLAMQLSGSAIVPQSELFCFKEAKKDYPVLLSQEVIGENLQVVLNKAYKENQAGSLAKLNKLDPIRWADLLLLSILIHPEDGKPDNYILTSTKNEKGEDQYAIVGIDNDHAFVETYNQEKDEAKAFQVKTVLYSLDQMQQSLAKEAVERFVEKDPEKEITRWLDTLTVCQGRYENLFSVATREALLKKESVPQMVLPPKSVVKLYERWVRLREALQKNPKASGIDLLLLSDPLVGLRYQTVFAEHTNPLARFHVIASPAYFFTPKLEGYKTLVTSSQLLKSQAISTQLLLNTRQYGPDEAKKEFYQALYQMQSVDRFVQSLESGDIESFRQITLLRVKEAVLKKTNFKKLKPSQQEKFIQLCLDKKEGLAGCQSLTLQCLDHISENDLSKWLERCQGLQALRLAGLSTLKTTDFINAAPNLKTLQLHGLAKLKSIHLNASQLRHLILTDLPDCQQLQLPETTGLIQMKIDSCPKLTFADRYTIVTQNTQLKLDDCNLEELMQYEEGKIALQAFFTEQLHHGNTFSTLWLLSEGIEKLGITNTLALSFSDGELVDILFPLSVLLHNTSMQWVEITDNKSGEKQKLNLDELRKLAGQFNLHIGRENCHLRFKEEESCRQLEQFLKIVSLDVECVNNTSQLMMCSAVSMPGALELLVSLKPKSVAFLRLNEKQVFHSIIAALIKALGDRDSDVRANAASALMNLKQATPEVIAVLIEALGGRNSDVRVNAASVLGNLKQTTPEVIAALINALGDENWLIRTNAASVLENLKQATPEVIAALINALGDEERNVRANAASALENLKQATPEVIAALINALGDEERNVRANAASALGNLKQATPEVIAALINALGDEERNVRANAASALGNLKQATPGIRQDFQTYKIAALINALGDVEEGNVRASAASAPGNLKQAPPEVIAALINDLGDKKRNVRANATSALDSLKQANPKVITALIKALEDSHDEVSRSRGNNIKVVIIGGEAVGKSCLVNQFIYNTFVKNYDPTIEDSYRKQLTCGGETVILDIHDTAGVEEYSVLRDITIRIGEVFIVCFSVTSRLSFHEVQNVLRERILTITGEKDMPVVLVGMKCDLNEDREVSYSDGEAFATTYGWTYLEASAKTRYNVVEVFEEAICLFWEPEELRSNLRLAGSGEPLQQRWNQAAVAAALVELGQESPKVIAVLLKALRDENWRIRKNTASALGNLKQVPPEVIVALSKALEDKNFYVKEKATSALGNLKRATPEVIAALIKALGENDGDVRANAASALGNLKRATPEVIAALIEALGDKDGNVRANATSALGNLKQATPEVIAALINALGDLNSDVRANAASALGKLSITLDWNNLWRFRPCVKVAHFMQMDSGLIQFLTQTQGSLQTIQIAGQPAFDLTSLRFLRITKTQIQRDSQQVVFELLQNPSAETDTSGKLTSVAGCIQYLFGENALMIKCLPEQHQCVLTSEDETVIHAVTEMLKALTTWASFQPIEMFSVGAQKTSKTKTFFSPNQSYSNDPVLEEALSSIVPSSELPDEDKTSIPTTSLFTTTLSYITLSGVCQESCRIKFKFLTLTEPIHADAPRPQFVDCHRSRRPGAPAQAVLFLA